MPSALLVFAVGCGNAAGSISVSLAAAGAGNAGSAGQADVAPVLSDAELAALKTLSPDSLPPAPPDVSNRFADDAAAAQLGKVLFTEPGFSGRLLDADNDGSAGALGSVGDTGKVACSGCHDPSAGFSDVRSFQRQISLGAGWGRRRAPSLLDVAQAKMLMWDGRHDALYNQPFGPIESVVEMNSSRLYAAEYAFATYRAQYEAIFGAMPPLDDTKRFPPLSALATGCQPKTPSSPAPTCDGPFHGMPGDGAEFDGMTKADQDAVTLVVVNLGKALGAYERTLTCGSSSFDDWMHGNATALSFSAQRGAQLFVGKGQCTSCHSGPFLSDQQFHNVGLRPEIVQQGFVDDGDRGAIVGVAAAAADPVNVHGAFSDGDDGRLPAVGPQLEGAFRTPILRCVSARPTFMHTGQLGTLSAVVSFFSRGGDASGYPGTSELSVLSLTPDEINDLTAFLGALSGPGSSSP